MDLSIQQIGILAFAGIVFCMLIVARRQLMDAIEQMRRGPRPPTHPLGSDDSFLLLRKRKRSSNL